MIVVTSSGWMTATRPRSRAPAWNTTPRPWAARPSSQIQLVASRTNDFGCAIEMPPRLMEARCHSVAARAKQIVARIARSPASAFTTPAR